MSIFRGGFTRAAAQAVTGATLRDLQALVNKSLLTLAERRYDVHELLRQFAAEKLSEDEAAETATSTSSGQAVRDRHSSFYCTLLQQHTPNWHNAHQLEALAELTREAANVQSAWRWALEQEVWQRLHEAIDSWSWYHIWRSLHADGEALCQAVCVSVESWVTKKPADAVTGYRLWAKAMTWYGEFAMPINISVQRFQQSLALLARPELAGEDIRRVKAWTLLCLGNRVGGQDRQRSRSFLEQSLSLYEVLQDTWGLAMALGELGRLDWGTGYYDQALSRVQASLDIHQVQGDQWEQVAQLGTLTWIYKHLGHLAKAEQLGYQALDLCQQLGDRASLTNCAANLAYILFWQGRFDEMKQWAEKSLVLCQEVGFRKGEGYASLAIAMALLCSGQYEEARQELRQTLALVKEVNNDGVEATVHWALGSLALVTATFDEAQAAFAEGLRLYQAVQDNYIFFALSGLGLSTCCYGDLDQSRQHFIRLLTSALRLKDFIYLLMALPGLALYLVRQGKVEQAITVWAQAQCQPFVANSQYYEDVVGRVVAGATADLPPDIIEAAQVNGRSQDIWHMAESLLADLQSGK
jgi:tetratricopeptide (TPR) repeat protein